MCPRHMLVACLEPAVRPPSCICVAVHIPEPRPDALDGERATERKHLRSAMATPAQPVPPQLSDRLRPPYQLVATKSKCWNMLKPMSPIFDSVLAESHMLTDGPSCQVRVDT